MAFFFRIIFIVTWRENFIITVGGKTVGQAQQPVNVRYFAIQANVELVFDLLCTLQGRNVTKWACALAWMMPWGSAHVSTVFLKWKMVLTHVKTRHFLPLDSQLNACVELTRTSRMNWANHLQTSRCKNCQVLGNSHAPGSPWTSHGPFPLYYPPSCCWAPGITWGPTCWRHTH